MVKLGGGGLLCHGKFCHTLKAAKIFHYVVTLTTSWKISDRGVVTSLWTGLSSGKSAFGSIHQQDSTCPNLTISKSDNL